MLTQGGTPGFFADTNTFVALFGANNSEKRRRDETIKSYIEKWKPELLIVAGRWTWQMTYCWGPGRVPSTAALEQACRQSTSWLAERCGRVVIVGDGPNLPLEDAPDNGPQIWKLYWKHGNALPKLFEESGSHELRCAAMALLRRAADPRVVVLDTAVPFQNSDGSLRYYTAAGALYRENNHLNKFGALELKPLLEPFFQRLAEADQQSPLGLVRSTAIGK